MYNTKFAKIICKITERITRSYIPKFLRPPLLNGFCKIFGANKLEAEKPLHEYHTLNAFFTRGLKPGARTFSSNLSAISSPVDGKILEYGHFDNSSLIQAKGIAYSTDDLLAHPLAKQFKSGTFMTIYLAPKDCHRIFTPLDGRVDGYSYVPGALYPVRSPYIEELDGLYIKNERVTTFMKTNHGHMACVKVAAMNVACIDLIYDDEFSQNITSAPNFQHTYTETKKKVLKKGDWMSTFNLGSTVVLIFEASMNVSFESFKQHAPIRYGEKIGTVRSRSTASPSS